MQYSHASVVCEFAKSALIFCALLPCADPFPDMVLAWAPRPADQPWHHLMPGRVSWDSFALCSLRYHHSHLITSHQLLIWLPTLPSGEGIFACSIELLILSTYTTAVYNIQQQLLHRWFLE
jgi:hypothetical protein